MPRVLVHLALICASSVLLGTLNGAKAARIRAKLQEDPSKPALAANTKQRPQIMQDVCGSRELCEVQLDVPTACAGRGSKCPAIFAFHGSGGSNRGFARSLGRYLHDKGHNFIGIYPQGTRKASGSPGWNTGLDDGTADDKAFILRILSVLRAKGWKGRHYAYGNSNGGAFCYQLGANGVMGFSGIAPRVSLMIKEPLRNGPGPYNWTQPVKGEGQEGSCFAPIAYMSLGGTADGNVPYNGGWRGGTGAELMSFPDVNEKWAQVNGCSEMTSEIIQASKTRQTYEAEKHVWDCPPTSPTMHYKIIGAGHSGANTLEGQPYNTVMLNFFMQVNNILDAQGAPAEPNLPPGC